MAQYYFETLPLHPQPEPLESFSSYVVRIASLNDIGTVYDFGPLIGQYRIVHLKDFNPLSLDKLSILFASSEALLLKTTFYHLMKKFGRVPSPHSSALFLSSSIAPYLRYCPMCLSENLYYMLPWRFSMLQGCHKHACQLLASCNLCGKLIPIFSSSPFQLGICPACKGDLRQCQSKALSDHEIVATSVGFQMLEYLLSPQLWEDTITAEQIGAEFIFLRQSRHLTIASLANQIGVSKRILDAVEQGPHKFRGASLQQYFSYAEYFNLSPLEIFNTIVQRTKKGLLAKRPLSQKDMINDKINEAISELRSKNMRITQRAICEIAHVDHFHFRSDTQLKAIAKQAECEREEEDRKQKEIKERELFERASKAVEQLEVAGRPVTIQGVANILGVYMSFFRSYPTVDELLHKKVDHYRARRKRTKDLSEDLIVEKVEIAIEELKLCGQPVTQYSVTQLSKVPIHVLRQSQRIDAIFKSHIEEKRISREEEIFANVESTIQRLHTRGQKVTKQEICTEIGLGRSTQLNRFPRIVSFVEKIIEEDKRLSYEKYYFERKNELSCKLLEAIQDIKARGKKVTVREVTSMAGCSDHTLKKYSLNAFIVEQTERL